METSTAPQLMSNISISKQRLLRPLLDGVYLSGMPHLKGLQDQVRAKEIVKILEMGECTLTQVGLMYGISRERVRQIYKIKTGKGARAQLFKKKELRLRKKAERLQRVKFICIVCSRPVIFAEGKDRSITCKKCTQEQNRRDYRVTLSCVVCKKEFHPLRVAKYHEGTGKYCSRKCFLTTHHVWEHRWTPQKRLEMLARIDRAQKLRADGMRPAEIAAFTGLHKNTINRYLATKLSIETKTPA